MGMQMDENGNLFFERDTVFSEIPWVCPKCGASQMPSKVEVKQIVELGREERVEYSGKIRPIGSEDGALAYECLVCGNIWPHEAPSGARQSSTSFLHPVTEREED